MSAERDRYLQLRREGTGRWEAFRQVNATRPGPGFSDSTASNWERWFAAEQGLPRRDPAAAFADRRSYAAGKR